ncbi:V-set and immunoglobulin domain-containing protein 1 [Oryzias latipes]|uniref:V-set and immunoglobulin domain-containing protein 1 n=1 Tax=Oryzias latipes TaxID=8090 RepID=UPI000CE252C1|nr:V-set and immunoglobulin domain-containing protein 1 [Oryzias latipes]
MSISPSGLVSVGSWVNLTCSSRAKPPVSSFSWFRISKDGDIKVADGDFYSFNVTENAEYRCTATNRMGNQTAEVIALRIKGAPMDTSSFSSSSGLVSITGGIAGAILLICLGFLIWWFKSRHSSSNQTHRTTQSLGEENAAQSQDIHYGEIVFSKGGLFSHSTQKTADPDQPFVVYSQINVGQSGNTQTGEDIYSVVKR